MDVQAEIDELRKARKAVILAHSYQPGEIQDIADFVGDSLGLSRRARDCEEEVVVFCGVHFMAETAHILSPGKTVLLPEPGAGCPLADTIDGSMLSGFKEHVGVEHAVIYINSPAEAKAESYACCTSANAVEVVRSVPADRVVFAPDFNLGTFVSRAVPEKEILVYRGACRPHATAEIEDLRAKKLEWPDAEVLVHPETSPEMWEEADHVLGTGGMIARVPRSHARRFLIGTESGMVYRLKTLFPEREFQAAGNIHCPNMKVTTLEKIQRSLEALQPRITLPDDTRTRALAAVERMTSVG
jgi:quinolinate synthase